MTFKIEDKGNFVEIEDMGAQLKSLNFGGTEYLWQGDETIWPRRAPNLFPYCGRLLNNQYIIGGKTYEGERHGFARDMKFIPINKTENGISFVLISNDRTRELYPFDFQLVITYTLVKNTLSYSVSVKNIGISEMFFSLGTHVGITLNQMDNYNENDYTLSFPKDNVLTLVECNENGLLSGKQSEFELVKHCIPLDAKKFNDTLIFKNIKSDRVELHNKVTGKKVTFEFDNSNPVVLWGSPEKLKFICIEPWAGYPDMDENAVDFSKKQGIISLLPGISYNYSIKIEIK